MLAAGSTQPDEAPPLRRRREPVQIEVVHRVQKGESCPPANQASPLQIQDLQWRSPIFMGGGALFWSNMIYRKSCMSAPCFKAAQERARQLACAAIVDDRTRVVVCVCRLNTTEVATRAVVDVERIVVVERRHVGAAGEDGRATASLVGGTRVIVGTCGVGASCKDAVAAVHVCASKVV